jgi:hypothetical protein
MVTFTDSDDRRSAYLRNKAIQNANAVRERRATVENPQWAMSRPADWYQNRDNLSSIKGTLANMPAVTTDQGEGRNMYQMLMNQMKGGDRGARLIDTRGLPAGARRTGRTMFQDPSKSQGFLGDVGSLLSGKNKAAVYADEYNPFPKAGFGADWYKDQFPIASGLGSFMEAAENFIPGATWAKQFLPKSNRVPLDRDLSWVPEGVGEYDEIPEIPFMEDMDIEDLSYEPETVWGPEGDPSIGMAGMEEYIPEWTGWNEEWGTDDLTMLDRDNQTIHQEDITETITEDDGEKFVLKKAEFSAGNLGTEGKYDYTTSRDLNIMNIKDSELRNKAVQAATRFNNAWLQGEDGEYYGQLEDLYQEYLDAVEAGAQPSLEDITSQIEDMNLQIDDELEKQADILNQTEELKNENRANNMLFDI